MFASNRHSGPCCRCCQSSFRARASPVLLYPFRSLISPTGRSVRSDGQEEVGRRFVEDFLLMAGDVIDRLAYLP
jgi:hypothetical protein